jgi:hypothetical protein
MPEEHTAYRALKVLAANQGTHLLMRQFSERSAELVFL